MKGVSFILIGILFSLHCFSQETYQMQIEVRQSIPGSYFEIEVHKDQENAIVYYRKLIEQKEIIKADNEKVMNIFYSRKEDQFDEMINIIKSYYVFEKDSIVVPSIDPTIQLSDSIVQYQKEIFKKINEDWEEYLRLDGGSVTVMIITDNEKKSINLSLPSKDNAPQIANLLNTALSTYRNRVSNPILSKEYTIY